MEEWKAYGGFKMFTKKLTMFMGMITKGHRWIKILKEMITAYGGVKC